MISSDGISDSKKDYSDECVQLIMKPKMDVDFKHRLSDR